MSEPPTRRSFLRIPSNWNLIKIWENKTPSQKWDVFLKIGKFSTTIIQMHLFTDLSIGPIAYIPGLCCILHWVLLVYTIYYYGRIFDIVNLLPTFCYFGLVVSTYLVYWTFVLKPNDLRKLLDVPGEYFYRNERQLTAYNRICSECITHSLKTYVLTLVVLILSFIGALIGPAYSYIEDGSLYTLYELRLPYFNQYPNIEFAINLTWQSVVSLLGISGLFCIELFMTMVNNAITVSSKLTVIELAEISDQLENGQISQEQCSQELKKIVMKIDYMNSYIQKLSDLIYWRTFLAPPSFTGSIVVAIYCQFSLGYPAGYGIAVVSYIQMAILCITGQNVTDRNQRILDALNDFKWYLLPIKDQKDMMHMINRFQNGIELTIGPFEKLSYTVLKILSQKIYSFLMFLNEFLN